MKKKQRQLQEPKNRLSDGHDVGASLLDFFRRSPLWGAGLDLDRDRSPMREVDLGPG